MPMWFRWDPRATVGVLAGVLSGLGLGRVVFADLPDNWPWLWGMALASALYAVLWVVAQRVAASPLIGDNLRWAAVMPGFLAVLGVLALAYVWLHGGVGLSAGVAMGLTVVLAVILLCGVIAWQGARINRALEASPRPRRSVGR